MKNIQGQHKVIGVIVELIIVLSNYKVVKHLQFHLNKKIQTAILKLLNLSNFSLIKR